MHDRLESSSVGQRLRDERQARALSLNDVAAEVGVSAATISRIENNKQSLDVELFLGISHAIGVPPAAILDERPPRRGPRGLVSELAAMPVDERAQLFATAARLNRKGSDEDLNRAVDSILASIDLLRDEILEIRRKVRRKR